MCPRGWTLSEGINVLQFFTSTAYRHAWMRNTAPVTGADISASIIREIPDNGHPYGTQLSAATSERPVSPELWPIPARLLDLSLHAVGEFWRCGLVALLDATVAVVRRTSGKKHQQADRGQCGRE